MAYLADASHALRLVSSPWIHSPGWRKRTVTTTDLSMSTTHAQSARWNTLRPGP
jgi:hypothetical protein